jgi:hypothetical protein
MEDINEGSFKILVWISNLKRKKLMYYHEEIASEKKWPVFSLKHVGYSFFKMREKRNGRVHEMEVALKS